MRSSYISDECFSWNCCDEKIQECIDRSKYVQAVRNQLQKKKSKKDFKK